MSTEAKDRTEETASADAPDTARSGESPPFRAVFDAGTDLFGALKRVATSLAALMLAETHVLRSSVALVFLGSVALVAFAVSLWACVVALIAWALIVATHSPAIALGVLIVLHLILVAAIWFVIKRAICQASFPETRSNLRQLGSEWREHAMRFQHAAPPPSDREASP